MRQPTLLVITHGTNDRLGRAEVPLHHSGLLLDVRHAQDIPSGVAGYAGLLVLGGPGAAFEDSDEFPTRLAECALVDEALRLGMPVLGICLGAQLLAHVRGGVGYEDVSESGWYPVQQSNLVSDPLLDGLPDEWVVMQNHTRHYTLPRGASLLMRGAVYPFQAFRVGENAWGFQFHLEADDAMNFPRGMDEAGHFRNIASTANRVFARFGRIAYQWGADYLPIAA